MGPPFPQGRPPPQINQTFSSPPSTLNREEPSTLGAVYVGGVEHYANEPCLPIVGRPSALGSRAMWFKLAECGWSPEDWEAWFVRVVLDATHTHGAKG